MLTRLSDKDLGWRTCVWHDVWTSFACAFALAFAHASHWCEQGLIGPLQLAIHVVQNHRSGEQKSRWDKTNQRNYHLNYEICLLFVLSQCDFCSPAWRFSTTWMASCKEPIKCFRAQYPLSFQLDVIRTWQFLCGINSILEIIINDHGQLYPLVAWATGPSGELGEERSETGERVKGTIH